MAAVECSQDGEEDTESEEDEEAQPLTMPDATEELLALQKYNVEEKEHKTASESLLQNCFKL